MVSPFVNWELVKCADLKKGALIYGLVGASPFWVGLYYTQAKVNSRLITNERKVNDSSGKSISFLHFDLPIENDNHYHVVPIFHGDGVPVIGTYTSPKFLISTLSKTQKKFFLKIDTNQFHPGHLVLCCLQHRKASNLMDLLPAPVNGVPKALPEKAWPKQIGPKFVNRVMPWVERFYHERHRHPEKSELIQKFGFTPEQAETLLTNKFYHGCLKRRGIMLPHVDPNLLTDRQIAAIAILTNFNDTRHPLAKLVDLGVTEDELNGWYANPAFNEERRRRADTILDNVAPDATAELARAIKRGNFQAIKFYYEITGQAQSPEAVNVKQAMQILIEAVQKHVKDPEVLKAIGEEVQTKRAISGL